jgi:membrane protein DedA with SNARE-associated domain
VTSFILYVVHWAGGHPQVAGMLVALVACLESLAFVGLIVPGAALMLGAGALVGVGSLSFWSTFAWAVAGAVVGDGVSYWLGHHYRDLLRHLKWIRSHPELLGRGEAFLRRHGGKSVLLARFVGPVRPVVPLVAGTLGMSPWRFYLNNILSALLWAPAHLIPGMAFGASLALAGEVAGRLALGLALFIAFVWAVAWAARSAYRWLSPRAQAWATRALTLAKGHRGLSRLIGDLVDPTQPATHPLALWLAILIAGTWLFFGVIEDVVNRDPLVYAGQSFYHFLQQLRTPIGDRVMVAVTELGDVAVMVPLVLTVLVWLLWNRAWRDAQYWLAAVLFGVLAVETMKYAFHIARPIQIYTGIAAGSFPSSHATMSTVVYGFLAVLCARSFSQRWRWIPFASAALVVSGIAFSRLYLGAHWLADVVAGLSLGVTWITVLSIARARHFTGNHTVRGLPLAVLAVLLTVGTWHIQTRSDADLERYAVRHAVHEMGTLQWWKGGWRALPANRVDLAGDTEQPLNVQWIGDLKRLEPLLAARGWGRPLGLNLRSAMRLLLSNPTLDDLPALPQLNDGQAEKLVLVKNAANARPAVRQYILRLWPSAVQVDGSQLWVGSVAEQDISKLPLIRYPHVSGGYDEALLDVQSAVAGLAPEIANRANTVVDRDGYWSGRTLLIRAPNVPLR